MASAAVGAAGGPIGIGVSVGLDVLKIGIQQLLGHSVRLKDATNENSAATQAIPAFTKDVQETVAALNAGSIDASEAISHIQQQQQAIYTYLRKQVGPPGTAWLEGAAPWTCDKTCTVGCCLYYSFVNVVAGRLVALLQAGKYPASFNLPTTYKSKYGYPGSQQMTLTVNPPKVSPVVSLLGGSNSVPASISGLEKSVGLSGVSPTNLLLGAAAIVTVIVGISSLRRSQ